MINRIFYILCLLCLSFSYSQDCLWESDFSDSSDWTLNHDATDCSLDWEIGQNLECGGFYPINPVESANGYYAMIDFLIGK